MAGLERFIDYERSEFIGRDGALRDRDCEPSRRLVTLAVDATEADAAGYEPICLGKELVGFVTSGGYGHCADTSIAMGYLNSSVSDQQSGRCYKYDLIRECSAPSLLWKRIPNELWVKLGLQSRRGLCGSIYRSHRRGIRYPPLPTQGERARDVPKASWAAVTAFSSARCAKAGPDNARHVTVTRTLGGHLSCMSCRSACSVIE
jgi:hypothetical protein